MRRVLLATLASAAIGVAGMAAPASAGPVVLVDDGITYSLFLNSITGNTGYFTLNISGINTASDTEGGRTGINAFAFNDPATGNATSGTSTGFTFHTGGLNSSGCDGSGNFYCFGNSGYVLPALGSGGSMSLNFNVTSNTAGSWDPANWGTTDFKIDWTGSQNNYDLVSKAIPLNVTPPVPEPATWGMMLLGFAGTGMAMRRSRRRNGALMQVA